MISELPSTGITSTSHRSSPDTPTLPPGESMLSADEVAREDLLTFLNAAFVSTGQAEFLTGGGEQRLGLGFLHEYVRGNYRRL